MTSIFLKATSIAAVFLALGTNAQAGVITFDDVAVGGCTVSSGGAVDGFTLAAYNGSTGAGINSVGSCGPITPTAHSGNNFALNYNSVTGQLTRDVGTFELNSLWVHADARVTGPTTVRFNGLDGINGTVLYTTDVLLAASWNQVTFAGWNNVKTLTWDPISPNVSNVAIDDISYDSAEVPEPASIFMLGIGLAGLAAARRKRVG